jgi:glycosyltransferase involved in cell wall biosynthesis
MKLLIATDAWSPQVNGVVTTLRNTLRELERAGHEVALITPNLFRTLPCPSYPEIRLAVAARRRTGALIERYSPDAIHIDTEGPVGNAARRHCLDTGRRFSTAYHTQFPEFVHARCRLPLDWSYRWMRGFHAAAASVMVPTPAIARRLGARGFTNLVHWSRGVDTGLFCPAPRAPLANREPVFLYAGRVAVEKSIEDFLALDLPGIKWVVGDGPARAGLQSKYPRAIFHGMQYGRALAHFYQQADVFVFPSRTDTFGLVMLEAMACGTPVAALPVTGPIDVVRCRSAGVLDDDLRTAALTALSLSRDAVRRYACTYSWAAATRQFLRNLVPVRASDGAMFGLDAPAAERLALAS